MRRWPRSGRDAGVTSVAVLSYTESTSVIDGRRSRNKGDRNERP
jgi:hypothetical protein